jgi:hypothetical protein
MLKEKGDLVNNCMIWLLILFFIFLIIYSFGIEPFHVILEKDDVFLKKLPSAFNGIKIAHLSDLHSVGFGRREKQVLQIIDQENPDFIFITGDINEAFSGQTSSCFSFWKELCRLAPTYVVFGNHLYKDKRFSPGQLEKMLTQAGATVLLNENIRLEKAGQFLWLVGVDDPHTRHHDLSKALLGVDNNFPRILLAHSPEIIDDLEENSVDLILTGHTHGGQVKIPGLRAFWTPTKYHGKYERGFFNVKGALMYVNRGIGVSKLPMRFNSRPVVVLLNLKRER